MIIWLHDLVKWWFTWFVISFISTRVSNELGAGLPQIARLAAYVAIFMSILQAIAVGLVMILGRNVWGYAFSSEEEVVKYVSVVMPIVAGASFLDAVQVVISGKYILFIT